MLQKVADNAVLGCMAVALRLAVFLLKVVRPC